MKTKLYSIAALVILIACAGCRNPWMEKILDPFFKEGEVKFEYNIGDIGPGGGRIFYHDPGGFTVQAGPSGEWSAYTAHYLEAAPADLGSLEWQTGIAMDIPGTETALGAGRRNTALILSPSGITAPAAQACRDYSGGGQTDWFLPSAAELAELRSLIRTGVYWTSVQIGTVTPFDQAFYIYMIDGNSGTTQKSNSHSVYPIRAF